MEIKVVLPFPYCEICAITANRRRPSVLGVIAVSSLLSLIFGMFWIFFGPQLPEEQIIYMVVPILIALSFSLVLGSYALRKRSKGQTSFYQPVKLKKTGHRWPADVTGLELAFTNPQYAQKFSLANQSVLVAKKLKVSSA
ncbi:hypothetical protein GTP41_23850 [Pseudoduganella sp. DS3]|uniref:Uncharacterized protein n=1 Tax=Pseudoduganella guangdongensis TaxID=2692179 RepID=A0A6N9HQV1_9BURK|nr:hypothetical protein [Pseudoduganella guangdongensis]MYN05135.1 hypothetical protein [Pseudoduganella guangdongensis]